MLQSRILYRIAVLLSCLLWAGSNVLGQSASTSSGKVTATKKKATGKKTGASGGKTPAKKSTSKAHRARVAPTPKSIKLTSAFLASTQLRPMAQQLASTRSAAAYNGVSSYAHGHPGEGAAAAYLALGHAYMMDHRFADAATNFSQAKRAGKLWTTTRITWARRP